MVDTPSASRVAIVFLAVILAMASAVAATAVVSPAAAQEEPADDPLGAELTSILERFPELAGESDAEQLRGLLGLPNAFTISFEPQQDGSTSRREEWFYYDYAAAFEFVDGAIIGDYPLDADVAFVVHPVRYEPSDFVPGATWKSLQALVGDPSLFKKVKLEAEYGVPATVRVGDLLMLVFDGDGKLSYVEAVPLLPEAGA